MCLILLFRSCASAQPYPRALCRVARARRFRVDAPDNQRNRARVCVRGRRAWWGPLCSVEGEVAPDFSVAISATSSRRTHGAAASQLRHARVAMTTDATIDVKARRTMVNASMRRRRLRSAIVHGQVPNSLLVISVLLNLWLSSNVTRAKAAPVVPAVVGTSVPALSGRSLQQTPLRIDYEQPTVVYYFSPTCAWCARNWSNVKALANGIHDRYHFVGVSTVSDIANAPDAPWGGFETFAPL